MAFCVLALAGVLVAACSLGPGQAPGPTSTGLVRCPAAAGGESDPTATLTAGLTVSCVQLTITRTNSWIRTVQAVVLGNQADPLAGRRLLVFHPGGPGISAVAALLAGPPSVNFDQFAVLSWDGTTSGDGTGACGPESIHYLTERTPADFTSLAEATGEECRIGFAGPDDIGAWSAADELEQLRVALGVDQIDFLTMSYGTAIAEAYMRLHPERVRRAVIDAPIGLDVAWQDRLAATQIVQTRLANELALACATDACTSVLDGVATQDAYARLRQAVLDARATVGSGNLVLTPIMFDQATALALRSEVYWPGYAQALTSALAGDGTAMWRVGERTYLDVDREAFYRSICADVIRPDEPAEYAADDPLLFAYSSDLAPCVAFPHGHTFADVSEGAPAGQVIVVTSPDDVLSPTAMLQHAPYLASVGDQCVTDIKGHTGYADAQVRSAEIEFFASGALPEFC